MTDLESLISGAISLIGATIEKLSPEAKEAIIRAKSARMQCRYSAVKNLSHKDRDFKLFLLDSKITKGLFSKEGIDKTANAVHQPQPRMMGNAGTSRGKVWYRGKRGSFVPRPGRSDGAGVYSIRNNFPRSSNFPRGNLYQEPRDRGTRRILYGGSPKYQGSFARRTIWEKKEVGNFKGPWSNRGTRGALVARGRPCIKGTVGATSNEQNVSAPRKFFQLQNNERGRGGQGQRPFRGARGSRSGGGRRASQ